MNFLKIVAVESVLYVKEYVRFCPYFLHILSLDRIRCRRRPQKLNWVFTSFMKPGVLKTILRDVHELTSVLSTFLRDLGENQFRISACDSVDQLRVSSKSAQERLFFSCRHK